MKLYYSDDWIKIYQGDSSDMSVISDKSVELIITSPPYNVGIDYKDYDDKIGLDDYYRMLERVFRECYRVLVSGGRICVNVPSCAKMSAESRYAFVAVHIYDLLRRMGFLDRDWLCWSKIPEVSQNNYDNPHAHQTIGKSTAWGSWLSPSNPYLRDCCEYIIIMNKEDYKLKGDKSKIDITKDEFLKFTNNIWTIMPVSKDRKYHPAPFPEEIPYRLIKLYSYQENTILDPFAGSGTTGYVAKKLRRKAILIDISEQYCQLCKDNVRQESLW